VTSYCNPGVLLFTVLLTSVSAFAHELGSEMGVFGLLVALFEARRVFEP
jgi:hypothetical protein